MPFGWGKKKWEKVACNYVLQEYTAGHGWNDVTEPSGEIPTVNECTEHLKPGHHYRLLAKAVEESEDRKIKGGTFVGVVWSHYEKLPGGVEAVKVTPKEKTEKSKPPQDVVGMMTDYAKEVKRVLEPIADISLALTELRDSLYPGGGVSSGREIPLSDGEDYGIPPLEYEGKAPWWIHPSVAKVWGDQLRQVIEYGATRLEGIMGKSQPPTTPEEKEERLLPSIMDFGKPTVGLEEKEMEERVEEEESVEEEEELTEEPSEEVETVPSLLEKVEVVEDSGMGEPCADCGKVVSLLPSGLCEECAKKRAKGIERTLRKKEEETRE